MKHFIYAIAFAICPALLAAAPALKTTQAAPAFGEEVRIQAQDEGYPAYLPGTRYARYANTFEIDFEFLANAFGPFPPGVGDAVVSVGELPPGSYVVRARMHDITGQRLSPEIATTNFNVPAPPPGIYSLPREPASLSEASIVLSSATYIDPATVRVSMAPDLVRVDFEFVPDAVSTAAGPEGYATYATAPLPPLAAGRYRLEAWGTPKQGQGARLYFASEMTVQRQSRVVEFYNEALDHYFMTARGEDIAALDAGSYGRWKRTGQKFNAWLRPGDAFPGAVPVCRFYAPLHNSHFFTADASECASLKAQEKQGREAALASGTSFGGWHFEDIAFYAMPASAGACPAGTMPVYRDYNGRAAQNDANHRFSADAAQAAAMRAGWLDEGIAFCAPA